MHVILKLCPQNHREFTDDKPVNMFLILNVSLGCMMRLAFCSVPFSLLNGHIKQTITLQSKFSIPVESQCSLLTRFVKKSYQEV